MEGPQNIGKKILIWVLQCFIEDYLLLVSKNYIFPGASLSFIFYLYYDPKPNDLAHSILKHSLELTLAKRPKAFKSVSILAG